MAKETPGANAALFITWRGLGAEPMGDNVRKKRIWVNEKRNKESVNECTFVFVREGMRVCVCMCEHVFVREGTNERVCVCL